MEDRDVIELIRKISFKDEAFLSKTETWKQIQDGIRKRKRKHSFLQVRFWAAASIVILIGLMLGAGFSGVEMKSGDTPLDILLPDGSSVNLSASSSIHFNKVIWRFSRRLTLNGDAAFEVVKGGPFSVKTPLGCISVLGTRFFVSQKDDSLHVACFEGSVCVKTDSGQEILLPGEQVDCIDSQMNRSQIRVGQPEYMTFENAPLAEVARQIEAIYGLEIVNKGLCDGLLFSGVMSTHNREEALEVVFGVCHLKYTVAGNKLILRR